MSLSQTALIGYLTTIKECAIEIEKHLGAAYVGCYETLAAYHWWDRKGKDYIQNARAFRDFLQFQVQTSAPVSYFQDLVKYYRHI